MEVYTSHEVYTSRGLELNCTSKTPPGTAPLWRCIRGAIEVLIYIIGTHLTRGVHLLRVRDGLNVPQELKCLYIYSKKQLSLL